MFRTVAESKEENGYEHETGRSRGTGKGNSQNGRELNYSRKVKRKGQQNKSPVLSQDLKESKGRSRSLRRDLEQELLAILYGFESSFENRNSDCSPGGEPEADAGCSSASKNFSSIYYQFDSEGDVFDNESDCCVENDFEDGYNELTIESANFERVRTRSRDKMKFRSKGKHQKYANLKNFCKKFAHPSELKTKKNKNAELEKLATCQKSKKERNRNENAERKLKESTSCRCLSWEAVSVTETKNIELKLTTKKKRPFKKYGRKHPTFKNISIDVNKVIKPKSCINRSKDISFRKLHITELFKKKSVKKQKSFLRRCTKDLSDYGFDDSDLWLGFGHKECYDDWVSEEHGLLGESYLTSGDDIMCKLLELQRREITPEDFDLLLQLDSSVTPKTVGKSVVDNLKIDKYMKESDVVEQCTICMEEYKDGSMRKYLPCGHAFHSQCIGTWLTTSSTSCPIDNLEVCPDEEKNSC